MIEWARRTMASNELCGFMKLSKANITDAFALLDTDSNAFAFRAKADMVEYLYAKIAGIVKSNKRLKKEVEELQGAIENMQDIYKLWKP